MLFLIYEILRFGLYLIFSLAPVYFLSYTFRFYYKRLKYAHIPGPNTIGFTGFYLGNLKEILKKVNHGSTYPEYLWECFKEYGPVFKIQILDRIIVHTIEPEAIREGLVERNYPKVPKFCKAISYPLNLRFLGDGLLTETSNQDAKNRKALFQEFFQKQSIVKNFDILNDKADLLINRLNELADNGNYFEIKTEIGNTVLDIIAKVAFGMDLSISINSENEFKKSIKFTLEGLIELIKDPLICLKPYKWAYIRKFKDSIEFLRKTARDVIQERLHSIQKKHNTPNDLLKIIIDNNRNNNIEQMIDDFVTFFIAGQETTTIALAFYILELGKNRNILEKVKYEINEKIGTKQNLNYDDIQCLIYNEYALKETLRLWPPVPSITRLITEKRSIRNYTIPKNTEIAFSVFSAGRSENFFSNPLEFNPDRFKKCADTNEIPLHAYFPFSLGSRGCIAQHFSKIEVKLIITKLIQNFDFELDPNQSFDCTYTGNLAPKSGVRCRIMKKK